MEIAEDSLDESRRWYATIDAPERLDRMVTEITLGVPKAESLVVANAADSAMWDRLKTEIDAAKAAGMMIVTDIE